MKNSFTICLATVILVGFSTQAQTPELKKASGHDMQYYISLPVGWSPKSTWPVVVVVESADKQFKENAQRFIDARRQMPFIIIAPFITTNGQQGQRDPNIYPYSKAVWDEIDKMTVCKFDMDGLQAIMSDVKKNYSGSDKIFLTGFEAGTHLVWAVVFQHPEWLYAAAPVAGNYRSRCMESNLFSSDASKAQLPIRNFTGAKDEWFGVHGNVYYQYLEAKNLALAHGYKNITDTEVPGAAHVPLPQNVLDYFFLLWQGMKK